ncbi:leucine-rich repeat-containing protein 3-like [Oncorhynchus tshawytscha]|uniref:leucine-rich repeat-containing protein 3-like n=1 Tax=Oncorhynchus tshawytscha TaxID=74940 RepID=UPI001C3CBE15|nr:leucine-rich repeat-containing protein 3-like [Oncorhynchus tshawytscha]
MTKEGGSTGDGQEDPAGCWWFLVLWLMSSPTTPPPPPLDIEGSLCRQITPGIPTEWRSAPVPGGLGKAQLALSSPSGSGCPDSCHCVWESSMVLCTDAGLHEFPQGLPLDTVILHLERNYIRSLPEGAFRELTHLRELYLSHNHINTLSSGALRHLSSELRLLDLSHNLLRQASRDEFGSTRAKTRLYNNPWHCDCTLQELVETLNLEPETVNGIMCESSVRSSGEGSRWEDPGGAAEHSGQPLVKLLNSGVNFCSLQRKTTDVAMLVTMFVWFFMVIVYVVYYVRQNQAETRRHLEYLKSLPSPRKTLTETDTISTGL